MINPELLKKELNTVVKALARRGFAFDVDTWTKLDEAKKQAANAFETIQAKRNRIAEEFAKAKRNGLDLTDLTTAGEAAKTQVEQSRERLHEAETARTNFLMHIPNIPLNTIPDGKGDEDNVVVRQVGEPTVFDFTPATHDALGTTLKGLDFEGGAALSGSRFAVVSGPLARLHRALIQFMIDTHVDHGGYLEVQTPYLVKASALEGTGQLPKFEDDLFKLERDGLYLIPTAEVPVTNLLATADVQEAELPLAFVCHTPCFRREAGSAGRDMKGLIRQHQFEKVELVRACQPQAAAHELDILLEHAEHILVKLGLPYRVMNLCTGDIGFSAEQTFDLEVWLPGQNTWREISSVSTFGTFQARRMGAKFKDNNGKKQFLATLNGSGLAAGRALVAVMENYQRPDGSIEIPVVLQPYMNGMTVIINNNAKKPKVAP